MKNTSQRRQIASRANGAKSHGPKTPEGKATSSYNAIKHGALAKCLVLENESLEGFEATLCEYAARFQPLDDVEFSMVEEMAACYGRMRRGWTIEMTLLNNAVNRQTHGDGVNRLTGAFSELSTTPQLALLNRYETRHHRMFQRALKNLFMLRDDRLRNEPSPISGHPGGDSGPRPKDPGQAPSPEAAPAPETPVARPAASAAAPKTRRPVVLAAACAVILALLTGISAYAAKSNVGNSHLVPHQRTLRPVSFLGYDTHRISRCTMPGRREFLYGLTVGAAASLLDGNLWAAAEDEKVIPFTGSPAFNPERPNMIWDQLTQWSTPTEQVFAVQHYGVPEFDAAAWKLDIGGLTAKPRSLTLADLKARPKVEHTLALECSGNGPAGGLMSNVKVAGAAFAPILKEAGIRPEGIEVVFFGADSGTEKIRDVDYKQNFARSLPAEDALKANVLLGYEMNGQPLTKAHGGPVRLVVPGWYGVAWVKWINRVEVHDRKYLNRFMARDYVTIRGEQRGSETLWRETSVGRMNLKSVAARVTRRPNGAARITGAAWSEGTPIKTVEVKIDDEAWKPAQLTPNKDPFAWTFWSFDWSTCQPGDHTITSRATDARGKVQPAPDDPFITLKKSRWENNQQAVRKIHIEA